MSCYRLKNIKQSKLLGSKKYTSCFSFDQAVEEHEFDDHLINQAPIVQISNDLQRIPHKITAKQTFPDLQCIKVQSMQQQIRLSFKQLSTESPIDSCENFQKYQDSTNMRQSLFSSTQIEPTYSKTTFRSYHLRKYSVDLQKMSEIPDFSTKALKTETRNTHRRTTSLTKKHSEPSNKQTTTTCWKKYSYRSLKKGISKQNSKNSRFGDISPWKLETQESLF